MLPLSTPARHHLLYASKKFSFRFFVLHFRIWMKSFFATFSLCSIFGVIKYLITWQFCNIVNSYYLWCHQRQLIYSIKSFLKSLRHFVRLRKCYKINNFWIKRFYSIDNLVKHASLLIYASGETLYTLCINNLRHFDAFAMSLFWFAFSKFSFFSVLMS